jgi:hypothetical protein
MISRHVADRVGLLNSGLPARALRCRVFDYADYRLFFPLPRIVIEDFSSAGALVPLPRDHPVPVRFIFGSEAVTT